MFTDSCLPDAKLPAVFSPTATLGAPVRRPDMLGFEERFTNVSRVGSGGMCDVFYAFDADRQHPVAIKRLRADRSRHSDFDSLLVEADVMNSLDHHCIPRVLDVFPQRMFKPYFSMDWIDGTNLCRLLSGLRSQLVSLHQEFPLQRLVKIVMHVLQAMEHSHHRGVLHRDLKPENIMVFGSQVRLIDWGCALRLTVGEDLESPKLENDRRTHPPSPKQSDIVGTPLYMSPEQVRGEDSIDERSDVFGVGAILYDCLALTTLIQGSTLQEVNRYTLAGQFARPSSVGLRENIPMAIEEVVMQAVAPDPSDRFSSARDFLTALANACPEAVSWS